MYYINILITGVLRAKTMIWLRYAAGSERAAEIFYRLVFLNVHWRQSTQASGIFTSIKNATTAAMIENASFRSAVKHHVSSNHVCRHYTDEKCCFLPVSCWKCSFSKCLQFYMSWCSHGWPELAHPDWKCVLCFVQKVCFLRVKLRNSMIDVKLMSYKNLYSSCSRVCWRSLGLLPKRSNAKLERIQRHAVRAKCSRHEKALCYWNVNSCYLEPL